MSQKSQHEKRSAGSERSESKDKQTRNDVSHGMDKGKEYSSPICSLDLEFLSLQLYM